MRCTGALLLLLPPPLVIGRWKKYEGYDSAAFHNYQVPLAADAILPTDCKSACEQAAGCHGFVHSQVLATSGCYFRSESVDLLAKGRRRTPGATLYIMVSSPEADEARFWLWVVIASCVVSGLIVVVAILYCVLSRRHSSIVYSRRNSQQARQPFSSPKTSPERAANGRPELV